MLKQFHSALNSNQCQISSHSIVAEPSQLTQDYHITFQCSQHIIFACVASLLFTLIHRAEQLARSLLSYTYLHAISLDGTTSYHSNSCWDLASPKNTHLPAKCAQLTRATFLQVNREISATLTELYVPYLVMHHTGPPASTRLSIIPFLTSCQDIALCSQLGGNHSIITLGGNHSIITFDVPQLQYASAQFANASPLLWPGYPQHQPETKL